jgi:hypothetical protein
VERILLSPADLPSLNGDPKNTLVSVCCPAIPDEGLAPVIDALVGLPPILPSQRQCPFRVLVA